MCVLTKSPCASTKFGHAGDHGVPVQRHCHHYCDSLQPAHQAAALCSGRTGRVPSAALASIFIYTTLGRSWLRMLALLVHKCSGDPSCACLGNVMIMSVVLCAKADPLHLTEVCCATTAAPRRCLACHAGRIYRGPEPVHIQPVHSAGGLHLSRAPHAVQCQLSHFRLQRHTRSAWLKICPQGPAQTVSAVCDDPHWQDISDHKPSMTSTPRGRSSGAERDRWTKTACDVLSVCAVAPAGFECSLRVSGTSSASWATCSSPKTYTSLSSAIYYFSVRAKGMHAPLEGGGSFW